MMDTDNEENLPDEIEPESLRRKWEREEGLASTEPPVMQPCPACGQSIRKDSFSCLFCGERVFWNSGAIGLLAYWLFRGKGKWVLLALLILALAALFLFFR